MTELLLKFAMRLEDISQPEMSRNYGPKFHRWLPDGETDSIKLDVGHPDITLEVWHERRGFLLSNEITFDYQRFEVDPNVMCKQGVLQGGPLFGRLVFRNPPSAVISAIRDLKTGDPEYITFAKFVITKLLYPSLSTLIGLYRINFGQYWIPSLKPWDSRENSIGAYCKHMNIQWSLDGGSSWLPFLPDDPISIVNLTVEMDSHYREYITRLDWQNIPNLLKERSSPSPAELFFNRACRFMDNSEIRIAFIDAVTALELAIEEFVQRSSLISEPISQDMKAFWGMPIKAQLITLAVALNRHSRNEIEQALEAIDLRHKTVHEGDEPPSNTKPKLLCLLKVITSFLSAPFYRFPSYSSGNAWAEPEEWNRIYAKHGFESIDV
jgi:hypothetical protein